MSVSSPYILPDAVQTHSLVIFNQVKPAKRQEYIRFFHEIISPALCSLERDQAGHVRLLEPTIANEDGSYTFVLLVEPAYLGVDYSAQTIIKAFYGEHQSRIHLRNWDETLFHTNGKYILVVK